MNDAITDKDITHAIRTCHWRVAVSGQRNLHLCGGDCNICERLIESGRCDTLKMLFRERRTNHKLLGNNIKSSFCDEYPHIKIPRKVEDRPVTPKDIEKYRSPIDVIIRETKFEFGNAVYKAVQNVGISVDKEELVKALKYDREQYDKGYADGYEAAMKKIQDALGGVKQ